MPAPSPRPHPTPLPAPPGQSWTDQLEMFGIWLSTPEGELWFQVWQGTVRALTNTPQDYQDELREQLIDQAFDSLGWNDNNKAFENRVMAEADRRARYANSAPDITFANTSVEIIEASSPQIIARTGVIIFSDDSKYADHSVDQRSEGANLGNMTTELHDFAKYGDVQWTYAVEAAKLDYLAEGEKKIESFVVTLWDQHDIATTKIDVTLTGVNDAPVITDGTFAGSAGESHAATGKINFSDVDLLDTHTATWAPVGSPKGTLTVDVTNDTTGTMLRVGEITWNYTIADAMLAGLAPGTYTDTFTITVNDSKSGGDASRDVQVSYTVPAPPDDSPGNQDPPPPGETKTAYIKVDYQYSGQFTVSGYTIDVDLSQNVIQTFQGYTFGVGLNAGYVGATMQVVYDPNPALLSSFYNPVIADGGGYQIDDSATQVYKLAELSIVELTFERPADYLSLSMETVQGVYGPWQSGPEGIIWSYTGPHIMPDYRWVALDIPTAAPAPAGGSDLSLLGISEQASEFLI